MPSVDGAARADTADGHTLGAAYRARVDSTRALRRARGLRRRVTGRRATGGARGAPARSPGARCHRRAPRTRGRSAPVRRRRGRARAGIRRAPRRRTRPTSPSASSSAASACCSARASSTRPRERRQRATHQRAILTWFARALPRSAPRGRPGTATSAPSYVARVVPRPAHVVRERPDPAAGARVGRRPGELHRALVPLPRALGRLDDAEHVRGVDRERVLARRAGVLPRLEELAARPRPSRPAMFADPPALEQQAHASARVVAAVARARPRRASASRLVEPALKPLRARELRQHLPEECPVVLVCGPFEEERENAASLPAGSSKSQSVSSSSSRTVVASRSIAGERRSYTSLPGRSLQAGR